MEMWNWKFVVVPIFSTLVWIPGSLCSCVFSGCLWVALGAAAEFFSSVCNEFSQPFFISLQKVCRVGLSLSWEVIRCISSCQTRARFLSISQWREMILE